MGRMTDGRETWHRLLEWDKGQTPAERLAAIILHNEGFQNIDPSHPLGGRDGLKDMTLSHGGKKWIGGVYFPRGKQSFTEIKKKFTHDIEGVKKNNVQGFVFLTNQELTLSEREIFNKFDISIDIQIYYLERIASLLNSSSYYGVRLEFLEIEMTKEEQLGFFSTYSQKIGKIENMLERLSIESEFSKTHLKSNELVYEEDEEYIEKPRNLDEIGEMEHEFFEKVWFNRHLSLRYRVLHKGEKIAPDIWKGALESAQKVIDKYGEDNLGSYSDFEWGMLNGKLSALRWVLGDEWDMLDT